MSATLDSDLFARYFGNCAVLAAGGRTFPVQHHFLEVQPRLHPGVRVSLCSHHVQAKKCKVTHFTLSAVRDRYFAKGCR